MLKFFLDMKLIKTYELLKYINTKFCIDSTTFTVSHLTQIKISFPCTAFQLLLICFCAHANTRRYLLIYAVPQIP